MIPKHSTETAKMARALREINEAIASVSVTVANECPHAWRRGPFWEWEARKGHERGAVVLPLQTQLYRAFKGDFLHGSRFYGHWVQNVPGDPKPDEGRDWAGRPWLRIDGEHVAEPDFSALHPRLLYMIEGRPLRIDANGKCVPDDDPYIINAPWSRKKIKQSLNTMLNARSKRDAIGAIAEHLHGEKAYLNASARADAQQVYDALADRNRTIAGYFGTGVGLQLQRIDADMAEYIMLRLQRRHGIVVLPIHDSFLCRERDRPWVEEAMNDAWPNVAAKARIYEKCLTA
jgi:hypothetical protein